MQTDAIDFVGGNFYTPTCSQSNYISTIKLMKFNRLWEEREKRSIGLAKAVLNHCFVVVMITVQSDFILQNSTRWSAPLK